MLTRALVPSDLENWQHGALLETLRRKVADIEALIGRLAAEGIGRIALMGGLAPSYLRRLSSRFADLLVEPAGDALDGALGLARRDAGL